MNALFVANFASNTGYAWNTIEAVFAGVARSLDAAGVRVHVSYAALPANANDRPMRGEPVTLLTADYLAATHSPRALATFVRLLRRHRIRLLYLTDQPTWSWRYAAFRLAGVRRIVVHDRTSGERTSRRRSVRALKKLLHRLRWLTADRAIAVSDYVAHRLRDVNGMPGRRIVRVHNGIDLKPFARPDPDYLFEATGLPPAIPVLFFAGRAQKYKGVQILLRAARRVQLYRDVAVVCCGDGPDRAEFEQLARELALRHTRFLGRRDDVKRLLSGATIAVVPSIWAEAFGLSVVEAMAAGIAVIGTRTGGIPELATHGDTGLLVDPGDDAALAAAILSLLDDPNTRLAIAHRARKRAHNYFGIARTIGEVANVLLAEAPAARVPRGCDHGPPAPTSSSHEPTRSGKAVL
jgi:glycosyltransferase involved in cell wall biosynthesis